MKNCILLKPPENEMIKIAERLKGIDWNFGTCKTNNVTHDFHSYPAKFIPQIPYNLIKLFSFEKDVVYDPFCGSGTTIVESILNNRKAIGNDVNPLAVLISKVKATFLQERQVSEIKKLLFEIKIKIDKLYGEKILFDLPAITEIADINLPNLEYWFDNNVVHELSLIRQEILSSKDKDVTDFLNVAFASIIVAVSFQDSNTRYVKVKKEIKPKDTVNKFIIKTLKMIDRIKELRYVNNKPDVRLADTRENTGFEEDTADLAITSPPYPNAYDYHLYHKYRMYWLGMNPLELKKKEIGSHAQYSKKNGFTEINFKDDMIKSFNEISRILKRNKYFCIVIGDSIIKGRKIENNKLLKALSKETPFIFQDEITRDIKLTKKSFNPIIGNIKTEHILIFKNQK
ncbi:MAG: DNA methyltransferase [Planctomycetota bacterium]|nr:DNA methyltransferase [Planctomycetota bacterium]